MLILHPATGGDERYFGLHRQIASASIVALIQQDEAAKAVLRDTLGESGEEDVARSLSAGAANNIPVSQVIQKLPAPFANDIRSSLGSGN